MSLQEGYNIPAAYKRTYLVATSNEVRQGMAVMLSGTAIVECDSDDDLYIGIAYVNEDILPTDTRPWTATAGERVTVVKRGSPCAIPVRSTAAGLTAGGMCCPGSGGAVDVTLGAGTALCNVIGQVEETATAAGELPLVNLGAGCVSVTAS
jgi:hypothetical protein